MASEGASGADRSDNDSSSDRSSSADRAESDLSEKSRDALSSDRGRSSGDDVDVAALSEPEARAASQERMAATGQPAKDRMSREMQKNAEDTQKAYEEAAGLAPPGATQSAAAADMQAEYEEAAGLNTQAPDPVAEEVATAEVAEAMAADLMAEFTTLNYDPISQQENVFTNADGLSEALVDMARETPPELAEAVYSEVIAQARHPDELVEKVDELVQQEVVASAALLGETAFEPPELDAVAETAGDLLAAHTSGGNVDTQSLSYAVETLAETDPSLAVGVKTQLGIDLSPADAASLNRQIAGERGFFEGMELAFENPGDGLIGAGKQGINAVTGTAEVVANLGNRLDAAVFNGAGHAFDALGFETAAELSFGQAAIADAARQARDWTLDPANSAQQGGANIVTAAEFAALGYGLARTGATTALRYGDEVLDAATTGADDLAALGDDVLDAPTSPGGITPGFSYTDEAINNFDYGAYLRTIDGPPPTTMTRPHAHHVVFKNGIGEAQQALVREAQDIMRQYDIDPIYGPENLTWAPNVAGQHTIDTLRPLVDELRGAHQAGAPREFIEDILFRHSQLAARR